MDCPRLTRFFSAGGAGVIDSLAHALMLRWSPIRVLRMAVSLRRSTPWPVMVRNTSSRVGFCTLISVRRMPASRKRDQQVGDDGRASRHRGGDRAGLGRHVQPRREHRAR